VPAAYGPAVYDAGNQVTTVGTTSYNYDADGNLTSDGVTGYTWNARGQLTASTTAGAQSTYGYDGLGRRTAKTTARATTGYLYDGLNTVAELAGTTPTATMLTGGTDQVFTRTSGGTTNSLLTDALGSTIGVADPTGTVTGEYSYQPFGATTLTGTDGGNPTRYVGREDDGSGQYYNRARYYSTTDQRFLSQDPLGLGSGDTNLYAYTTNQPTDLVDPLGTESKNAIATSGASGLPVQARGLDGRFLPSADQGHPDSRYSRVTLREMTKSSIRDAAPRDSDGNYIDPNTGQIIPKEGPFHYGHRPTFEYWRNRDLALSQEWSREEFITYENDPSHYQIEDPYNNLSHRYEQH
jgi:RHS repeat-associated protein